MKTIIILMLIVAMVFISGCCGATPEAPKPGETGTQGSTNGTTANNSQPANATTPPVSGDGTIVDVKDTTTSNAKSQVDCSTVAPTCDSCLSKAGCGWCKSRNGCFFGGPQGPAGDVTCEPVDWATSKSACSAPVGGDSCVSKTNCADCLTGSGCKWCQEGTKCTDASASDVCASGGWRTKSYECYGGS